MWKDLLTSNAFALIASSSITAVATFMVTYYGYKRSERPGVKKQAGEDVYKAWIKTLRGQVNDLQKDFDVKAERMQQRISDLETELDKSTSLNKKRLDKLLALSRQFNVDISDVV